MISIIVAIAKKNAIGKNNDLLWHLPNDLKRFKELTSGHTVIMGRNTWLSLPKKPLPNRVNIVLSDIKGDEFEGCILVSSLSEALKLILPEEEAFIMGGGMIYKQFLPYADRLYLTKVDAEFEADTFFPEIKMDEWKFLSREDHQIDEKHQYNYSFIILDRIK